MTQKTTRIHPNFAADKSSTTTDYEKSALTVLIALLLGRKLPKRLHQRGRKKIGKGEDGNQRLPAGVHGTIRAKIRISDHHGCRTVSRYAMRVSVTGNIAQRSLPKAEIDLSDEGQIKMLDAYARLFPTKAT